MNATKTLLEVEADVKEKFASSHKEQNKKPGKKSSRSRGSPVLNTVKMKKAKDQLRKAIDSRNSADLDEALLGCAHFRGFEKIPTHKMLIQWADRVKQEAYDVVDTSAWPQSAKEEYVNSKLREAVHARDIIQLNNAVRMADELEAASLKAFKCDESDSYREAVKVKLEISKEKSSNMMPHRYVHLASQVALLVRCVHKIF